MDKGVYIRDIQAAEAVSGLFCVRTKRLLETRNGDPYLALTLVDRTGEIEARVWDQVKERDSAFGETDYVRIHGEAQRFRDEVQLKVTHLERVDPDGVDPEPFLPVTSADREDLWAKLRHLVRVVRDPTLGLLLRTIFGDRDVAGMFRRAPAAKRMHHAYIGGLLEHTVSLGQLVGRVSQHYPHLDQDLLMAAALLHDIGKIDEFRYDRPPLDYSDQGRLLGHMALGVAIIDRLAAAAAIDPSAQRIIALKHVVLSHHGQREFGAPVVPMTEEAVTLHLLDDLDAKVGYLHTLRQEVSGPGHGWTGYQRLMDRYFYLRPSDAVPGGSQMDGEGGGHGPGPSGLQPTLWSGEGD